jgi:Ca2+-binding EF-hand superfamily protein
MKTRHTLTALGVPALAVLAWAAAPLFAQPPGMGPGPGDGHPFSWDQFAERHDVNGDGQVTQEELEQTTDPFGRLDANGDGVITEADFQAHRSAMVFTFLAHRADANDDGDLTAAELDTWFAERDDNGDGRLDAEDFAGDRPRARGPHPFLAEALDADGDGLVTRADFTALAARFDENGDGVVEADELPDLGPMHHGRYRDGGPGRRPHRGPRG